MHDDGTLYFIFRILDARIELFTDKEVINWINSKLKDKKYYEVLTLTMEEFVEQEQNKKQKEQETEKTQPKRGPEPHKGEEGKDMLHFYIQHASIMHTACSILIFVHCFSQPVQAQTFRCRLQAL